MQSHRIQSSWGRVSTWVIAVLTAAWVSVAPGEASAEVDPAQMTQRASEATPLTYHFPKRYAPAIDNLEPKSGPAVERLKASLGFEEFPAIDVWVLPKAADYFELNDQKNRAPEWAIGLSLGDQKTVVVARDTQMPGGASTDIGKTFVHELTHVAVDVAREGADVPRWFHEGLALMIAEEWTAERQDKLARAASTDSLMSLADIDRNFPAHHNLASLAYAESFHFVRYIEEHHGRDAFAQIMEELRAGEPFPDAVEAATGRSLAALESNWRTMLTENTSWLSVLRDDFTIFFGAVLIFILAYVVQRRRRRGRYDDEEDESGEWSYDRSKYPLPGDSDHS